MIWDKVADVRFGICEQAWAIAHLLAGREPDFADYEDGRYQIYLETFPFYNGRECWIGIQMTRPNVVFNIPFVVVFGECRNSDEIIVAAWKRTEFNVNPPSVEEYTDEIHSRRLGFRYDQTYQVAQHIYDVLSDAYKEEG